MHGGFRVTQESISVRFYLINKDIVLLFVVKLFVHFDLGSVIFEKTKTDSRVTFRLK